MRGVDALKIDRSFVDEIRGVDLPAPLVAAVLSLALSLGVDVVAEGIEHRAPAAHLARRAAAPARASSSPARCRRTRSPSASRQT